MDGMPDIPGAHARIRPGSWTWSQRFLAAFLLLLGAAITAVAFMVIWSTVTSVVRPSMRDRAWTVPVACEIAFLFLFLLGVLLHWRKAPPVASRSLIMGGIIAGSVELNVYASRGDIPALVAHLVVTGAFYSVLLAGKAAFTSLRGGKIRADRIALLEWALHPARSLSLAWWMQAWGEPSRKVALARYQRLLYAIAVAQSDLRVGRVPVVWRRRLPLPLRFQFASGILPDSVSAGEGDWQDAVTVHVREHLTLLDATPPGAPEGLTPPPPAGQTVTAPDPRHPARQKAAADDAAEHARKHARARRLLSAIPAPTLAEVAAKTGLSERTVSRIKSKMPRQLHAVDGTG